MNRLTARLPVLQTAIIPSDGGGPVPMAAIGDVVALIRAITRKAKFADMHMALLSGIDWERYDDLGRRPVGNSEPLMLKVPLSEASITIEHPGAAIDHIYLAFDGLIAALVNMTDTFGRLVNAAYALGIDPRKASLFAVRDQCSASSSLGTVLWDASHTEWLRKVRDLRGRCQHAGSIQFTPGVGIAPERTGNDRIEYPRQKHVRQLPVTISARTAVTKHGTERLGYLAYVVQCHQHHQRATLARR